MSTPQKPVGWRDLLVVSAGALLALTVIGSAATGVVALASDRAYDAIGDEGIITAVVTSHYVVFAFAAALIVRNGRFTIGAFLAIVLSMIAWFAWMMLAWRDMHWDAQRVSMFAVAISLLIIGLLHTGGFTCLRTRSTRMLVLAIFACGFVWLAVMPASSLLMWIILFGELRPAAAFAFFIFLYFTVILGIVGILVSVPIAMLIRRENRKWEEARDSVSRSIPIAIACPLCGSDQNLRTGLAKCTRCAAIMHIGLEEPRCECGYLLFKLQSPTCPECGREIEEQYRWREANPELRADSDERPQEVEPPTANEPIRSDGN